MSRWHFTKPRQANCRVGRKGVLVYYYIQMAPVPDSAVICAKCGKHSGILYYVPETGEVWICKKCLPIVFARGEEVEVSDDWVERAKKIYLTTIEWAYQPYVCVHDDFEWEYREGIAFYTIPRMCIRKLQPIREGKKFTKQYLRRFGDKYGRARDPESFLVFFCEEHGMLEE